MQNWTNANYSDLVHEANKQSTGHPPWSHINFTFHDCMHTLFVNVIRNVISNVLFNISPVTLLSISDCMIACSDFQGKVFLSGCYYFGRNIRNRSILRFKHFQTYFSDLRESCSKSWLTPSS